jgi:HAD superfamily phosphoserine phosphatase-like hydrolase
MDIESSNDRIVRPGAKLELAPVLLLDVCHTLFKSNTTFDFLDFYLGGTAEFKHMQSLRGRISYRVRQKFGAVDTVRLTSISLLKDHPKVELERGAREFVKSLRVIEPVFNLISHYREEGYEIALLSSSLDFIVQSIGESLGISRWHATRLNYVYGTCNGEIKEDLLGEKQNVIKSTYMNRKCVLISDNKEDINCLPFVSKFVAVYPKSDIVSNFYWYSRGIRDVVKYE